MPGRQKIVAVVDDDPSVSKAIHRLLSALGFRVETMDSAHAFLASSAVTEADCLLLDIHLGSTSGLDLRRQLRLSGCTIPVIFMTAFDDEQTRSNALAAGCIAYLPKPFLAHMLVEAITKATG
jgi:FixJ family two-component response regulator